MQAGAFWLPPGVGTPSLASSATARAATPIASRIAWSGRRPRGRAASRWAAAAWTAVADASSGRAEEETPSQTTASTAASPPGRWVAATVKASSLRWCRSPRSVTPATPSAVSSWWSRGRGWAPPQLSQYPSAASSVESQCTQRGAGAPAAAVPAAADGTSSVTFRPQAPQ